MSITKDRIELVKQTLGIDTQVRIHDLKENGRASGTTIELTLPLLNRNEYEYE